MSDRKKLEQYAKGIDVKVDRELRSSLDVANAKFYTEAVLRLGRSIEAAVHCIASEAEVALDSHKTVLELSKIRKELKEAEVGFIKGQFEQGGLALQGILASLKSVKEQLETTGELPVSSEKVKFRPVNEIFGDLVVAVNSRADYEPFSIALETNRALLGQLMNNRNKAAHPPRNTGNEFNEKEFENFISDLLLLFRSFFDIVVGIRAYKCFVNRS